MTNGGVTEDVSQPEVIADVTEVSAAVSSKDDRDARNIATAEWQPRTVADAAAAYERPSHYFQRTERVRFVPRHFISPLFRDAAFVRRTHRFPRGDFPCGGGGLSCASASAAFVRSSLAFRRQKVTLHNLFLLFIKNTGTDISRLSARRGRGRGRRRRGRESSRISSLSVPRTIRSLFFFPFLPGPLFAGNAHEFRERN